MAERLLDSGFFAAANPYRTYGYPVFIAVCSLLVGRHATLIAPAVVAGQVLVLLAAAAVAAWRLLPSNPPWRRLLVFASLGLHPFVLAQAAEQLTEVLGAALVLLAIVLLLSRSATEPQPEESLLDGPSRHKRRSARQGPAARNDTMGPGRAFAAMMAAGASVAVRPANAVIVLVLGGLLFLRVVLRRAPARVLLAGALGACLPLVPQGISNVRVFGRTEPLIVEKLYGFHLVEGTRLLKYTTSIEAGTDPHVEYRSPLHDPANSGPAEFFRRRPLSYLATLALHAFALLDWDLIFSYNRELAPWTRWLSTPFGFASLFLAGVGLLPVIRAARHDLRARWDVAILITVCAAYAALYVPTVVENRFSLPIYLLLAPWAALGAASLWSRRRQGRPGRLLVGLALLLVATLGVSLWIASHARLMPA